MATNFTQEEAVTSPDHYYAPDKDQEEQAMDEDEELADLNVSTDEKRRRRSGTKYKEGLAEITDVDKSWVTTPYHIAYAEAIRPADARDISKPTKKNIPVEITAENAYDDEKLPEHVNFENIRYNGRHYARADLQQCAAWSEHPFCEYNYVKAGVPLCGKDREEKSCKYCMKMSAGDRQHRLDKINQIIKAIEENPNYSPSKKHSLPRFVTNNDIARVKTQEKGKIWEATRTTEDEYKQDVRMGRIGIKRRVMIDAACQTVEVRIFKALNPMTCADYIYMDQPPDDHERLFYLNRPAVTRFFKKDDADRLTTGIVPWSDVIPADLLRNRTATIVGAMEPMVYQDEAQYYRTAATIQEIDDEGNIIEALKQSAPEPTMTDPVAAMAMMMPSLNISPENELYRRLTPWEIQKRQEQLEKRNRLEKLQREKQNMERAQSLFEPTADPNNNKPDVDLPDMTSPVETNTERYPIVIPNPNQPRDDYSQYQDDGAAGTSMQTDAALPKEEKPIKMEYPICNALTPHLMYNITNDFEQGMQAVLQLGLSWNFQQLSDTLHPHDTDKTVGDDMPWFTFPMHPVIMTAIAKRFDEIRAELTPLEDVWSVLTMCSSLSTKIDMGSCLPRFCEVPVVAMNMEMSTSLHTKKSFYLGDMVEITNREMCHLEEKLRAALVSDSQHHYFFQAVDCVIDRLPAVHTTLLKPLIRAQRIAQMKTRRALVESLVSVIVWRRRNSIRVNAALTKEHLIDLLTSPIFSTTDLFFGN